MRIIKVIVLIALIQVPFIFANYARDKHYANYIMTQKIYKKALSTAMHDATTVINKYSRIELVEGTPEIVIDPKVVVDTFLNSFSVQIVGRIESILVQYLVPFIAIVDVDGVYTYEITEINNKYEVMYYDKVKYTRSYLEDTMIQFYLNNHIKVFINNSLVYEGSYYDGEYTMPEYLNYETEKIAAVAGIIEERIDNYVSWGGMNEVTIPILSKDDWDKATTDISIIALVFEERGQRFRVVNNCGIINREY